MPNKLVIRPLREKSGMTQRKLAADIGVSPGAVAQWELGTTQPTADNLVALADAFGVPMDALFGRETEQTSA